MIFYIKTGKFLHTSAKIFNSEEDWMGWLRHVIERSCGRLNKQELLESFSVFEVDSQKQPDFRELFSESHDFDSSPTIPDRLT